MPILAYHITWTTYGTWLSGDDRGWKRKDAPGVQSPDDERQRFANLALAEEPVTLSVPQRAIVEQTIREHCARRRWSIHALNARSNHVHIVLTADRDPDEVMKQLKAWCSRRLSDDFGLHQQVAVRAGRRHWFTEGGDKRIIDNEDYLNNAIHYVRDLQ
jgi:REP element-mobilizing transposase RayT